MPNFAVTGLGGIQDQQDYGCLSSHVKKKKQDTKTHKKQKTKNVILSSSNLYLEAGKKPPIAQH